MKNLPERKDVRRNVSFPALCTLLFVFAASLAAGCGPTKKEYAINEALLVDQTRMLENQLYRAHFQVQRLEQENKRLRAQLESKGIKVETPEAVPLNKEEQLNVGNQAAAQAAPQRLVRTAAVPKQPTRQAAASRNAAQRNIPLQRVSPRRVDNYQQ